MRCIQEQRDAGAEQDRAPGSPVERGDGGLLELFRATSVEQPVGQVPEVEEEDGAAEDPDRRHQAEDDPVGEGQGYTPRTRVALATFCTARA